MDSAVIIASCPLRISLFGGSTDNPFFIEKFGYGSVISFTSNLKTYVTLTQDKVGANKHNHKYVINYSIREEVSEVSEIKNELVRCVLEYFNVEPVQITLTSDVYSQGSGLASSSSYLISLIKAVTIFKNISMTDSEICSLAYELELKFNPYCGYQDPHGCGIGGFKRIEFLPKGVVKHQFLSTDVFEKYDMHLVFTGVTRNSKIVLKDVTKNIDKSEPLLENVILANKSLDEKKYDEFFNLFKNSWEKKKNTSDLIVKSLSIKEIDECLNNNETVIAHKLCGAGNGGFFLVFSHKNSLSIPYEYVKIDLSVDGVSGVSL